jgi:hypothetical protein
LNGATIVATPRDLVKCISEALGVPISVVANMDRKLMEAGLRTKKGHGRGSAIMTYADASMDILAVAATVGEISRAPEYVAMVRALPLHKDSHPDMLKLCAIIGGSPREYKNFGAAVDGIMRHAVRAKHGAEDLDLEISIASEKPLMASIVNRYPEKDDDPKQVLDHLFVIAFGPPEIRLKVGMFTRRQLRGEALQHVANSIGNPD